MAVDKGTIFVTGANGGLGSAIVEQIASKAELSAFYGLYTVRNTTHAAALASALAHGPTHRHDVVALDLTKLDNIRQVAEGINVSLLCSLPVIELLVPVLKPLYRLAFLQVKSRQSAPSS